MKERSSKEREQEEKRREGSPDRNKKGWQGPPSENVERRRGPGQSPDQPDKRMPNDRR